MSNRKEILDTLESMDSPTREHMLQWYAQVSKNSLFKYLKGENLFHATYSAYVKYKYPTVLFHHSPNEGKRGRFARWMVDLLGVRSVPDCMFYRPKFKENGIRYCGLALELKYEKNKPSEKQGKVLKELEENGWSCWITNSLSSAISITDNYLNGKK